MLKRICSLVSKAASGRLKAIAFLLVGAAVATTFPVQFVKSVSIYDGKDHYSMYSFGQDTQAILNEASIEVSGSDDVVVKNRNGDSDITISINRSFPVYVTMGGDTAVVNMASGTVKDAIAKSGFVTDNNDSVNYNLDTPVKKGMQISVDEVSYKTKVSKIKVKPKTIKVKTKKLAKGKKKVLRKGKSGVKVKTTVQKLVNGKVADTSVNTVTTVKPTSKKVLVGTKKKYKNADTSQWISQLRPKKKIKLDASGKPKNYKKVIKGTASAYCTGTTCSTGVSVKPGYIAVNPAQIPYGTEMYIRTASGNTIYGYAVAADTGGFVAWGNTVADLYMSSYSQCINFGRQDIEIYVMK